MDFTSNQLSRAVLVDLLHSAIRADILVDFTSTQLSRAVLVDFTSTQLSRAVILVDFTSTHQLSRAVNILVDFFGWVLHLLSSPAQ